MQHGRRLGDPVRLVAAGLGGGWKRGLAVHPWYGEEGFGGWGFGDVRADPEPRRQPPREVYGLSVGAGNNRIVNIAAAH